MLVLVPAMRILHRTVAVLLLRRNIVPSRVENAAWISTIHEKLDVYKCSLELFALTRCVLPRLARGEREIRDQLRRAALSISLNIAEGTGKPTPADRARYHAIARGSAMECGALLDVCRLAGLVSAEEAGRRKALLVRIVAMLTKMCRS